MTLKVDTDLNSGLEPPERLLLEIVDDDNIFNPPVDYTLSDLYFDGYYDKENGSYTFVITQFAQEILKGHSENTKLYIFPQSDKVSVRRAVLKNNFEFKLVYTKY